VREQRWPWLLTAGLMLAAAVAAAWSTYLHWLPCRGSMLRGSIIHGYGYDYNGGKFSDLCLRRMDGDQGPWESELNVVAMVLLGVAWLALVLGLRWQPRTKAVAAVLGLATLALRDGSIPLMLLLNSELAAVVALVAILAWQPAVRGRRVLRLVVVLWGATAFGAIHTIVEYVVMINFSDANWDAPPGTGYLTVATITISAILTVIMTLRTPKRAADAEPEVDSRAESRTLG
jgi:hypothetical protein